MSLTHKTTLLDEADTTAVKAYISTMLDSHRDAGKKREVLAYLKRLLVTDKDALAIYHANHRAATELIKTHSQRVELTHEDEIQHLKMQLQYMKKSTTKKHNCILRIQSNVYIGKLRTRNFCFISYGSPI